MPDLTQNDDFPPLIEAYQNKFGATFSPIMVPEDMTEDVLQMMQDALAGKCDRITDEEPGITLPDDAQS